MHTYRQIQLALISYLKSVDVANTHDRLIDVTDAEKYDQHILTSENYALAAFVERTGTVDEEVRVLTDGTRQTVQRSHTFSMLVLREWNDDDNSTLIANDLWESIRAKLMLRSTVEYFRDTVGVVYDPPEAPDIKTDEMLGIVVHVITGSIKFYEQVHE